MLLLLNLNLIGIKIKKKSLKNKISTPGDNIVMQVNVKLSFHKLMGHKTYQFIHVLGCMGYFIIILDIYLIRNNKKKMPQS